MKVIKNERVVFFDVDDTLIMWNGYAEETAEYIKFQDAYSSKILEVIPNHNNIKLLQEKAARGYQVIVWSQGGWGHAKCVIEALKLESFVDIVMTKPTCYVDDLDVSAWFPKRVYIDAKARYKS